jgi:rhodanese-related sulfurtransferase
MSIRHRPDLEQRGSVLWRSVVVLLLVGAGLGLVSNAVLLAAGSKRGLTWVRTDKVLPTLEDLATPPSTTPEPVATDVAPVNPTASTPTTTAKKPPASSSAPKPSTPPPASSEAKPSGGPPAAGTTAAPNAEKSVPTATKPDVPTVPDSRDPIQAKMPMVKKFHDADAALFVDAREAVEYAEGHIAGAVSLPFDEAFKDPKKLATIDPGTKPIIVYCGGGDCEASRNLAYSLIDAGRKKVVIFEDGFPAWKTAGYPVATGKEPGGAK